MLEPSSSEESDVDADEAQGYAAAAAAADAPRPGRQLPVLGGRVAGFAASVHGAYGFGQTGLAGALNAAAAGSTCLSSTTSLTPSSTSAIAPPNIDLLQQRSHSLSTGMLSFRRAPSPSPVQRVSTDAGCQFYLPASETASRTDW